MRLGILNHVLAKPKFQQFFADRQCSSILISKPWEEIPHQSYPQLADGAIQARGASMTIIYCSIALDEWANIYIYIYIQSLLKLFAEMIKK